MAAQIVGVKVVHSAAANALNSQLTILLTTVGGMERGPEYEDAMGAICHCAQIVAGMQKACPTELDLLRSENRHMRELLQFMENKQ